jgi:2-polyprenyl-3-methyl-5-hydroxy-6-metoxy-1,4-benzoquinol methylase
MDLYKYLGKYTKGKKVLEIGFGTGAGSVQLQAETLNAWEIDRYAVEFAKEVWGAYAFWRVGDITKEAAMLPHDVVVAIEVLEHIPDWGAAMENIVKSLKPDGKAIISGPNANADLRKTDLHEREWTAKEFYDALSKYFSKVQLYDYTLTEKQEMGTKRTPIVAVCRNG